ncbi:MAG: tryptophan halogenase family protein [Brevundimonas sp.]|uniref:tryptophan halogenase family protein n=1 Tax=Brevundimonas sp. TaxID=1871086 RepID=UPI00391CBB47
MEPIADPSLIRRIVILGGGTAGWMTAAALSHRLAGRGMDIVLIESDAIGIVGVGEATLPHIRFFNTAMGIDEQTLIDRTKATFKLGIQFVDWGRAGEAYIHPFGAYGEPIDGIDFHHIWAMRRAAGDPTPLDDYSYPVRAAEACRFQSPIANPASPLSTFSYAFQFDASLYAAFLKEVSCARGVVRTEGKVVSHSQDSDTGDITALTLEDGRRIEGDLFIDCSGFRGHLIAQALETPFDDWSHWLPCDSAFAVPCETTAPVGPYTRATARQAGWQWRIPLQHRTGNGHVFSSAHISDEAAVGVLMSNLEGPALAEPRRLSFRTGRRRQLWNRNVVAVGLSGGFLEPLESTSIYLIQLGITTLLDLFPDKAAMADDAREYNAVMALEFERIRDFLVLHYVANQRDEPFWREMRSMTWPDSLSAKVEAFVTRGLLPDYDIGVFHPPSWLAVLAGQNILPQGWDPRAERLDAATLSARLARLRKDIHNAVAQTPDHMTFIRDNALRHHEAH